VYEAAEEVRPLGVGINLQPTAVRELTELGLAEQLGHAGIAINVLSLFNKHGQLICSEQRGLSAGYRWPQYAIHRGRLQLLLWRAAQERLGTDNVRSGLEFIHFSQCDARVVATFRDRASGMTVTEEADVLVGADGIHSAVRRQLYPREGEPRFGGQTLWRFAIGTERSSAAAVRPFVGASSTDDCLSDRPQREPANSRTGAFARSIVPGRFARDWAAESRDYLGLFVY
jgi:2-polyprenyl-6-methoxyphenol hydroxylase-like FAD-dependent oxidoreductase